MKSERNFMFILLSATICMIVTNCGFPSAHHRSSSVVQYLYPNQKDHVETPDIPHLALPLRVGIAFVPENTQKKQSLTERDKMELMQAISLDFEKYDFVKSIELIPSAYIRKEGSFTNLDQIKTMYGIDVITLLSYDQTQFTDEGMASITYWTLIGAYIIPGEKNDTHTMVDAAVYDIQSRKMLFRAPGISHLKSRATPVNLSEQLRLDSMESFKEASTDLVTNLKLQLELFQEKVKKAPKEYQITHRQGYRGGGSLDATFIIMICLLGGYRIWVRLNNKA